MDHAATLDVLSVLTTTFCRANLLRLMILRRTRVDFRHMDAASQKIAILALQILSSIKRELPFSRLKIRQFRESNILSKGENFRVTKSAIQRFVIRMDTSFQMQKNCGRGKQKKFNRCNLCDYTSPRVCHLNQRLEYHSEEKSSNKCKQDKVNTADSTFIFLIIQSQS